MSWFERLVEFYGRLYDNAPLYHEMRQACAVADISESGALLSLCETTIIAAIPVTERSAVRTNAIQPHPLFDTVQYLGGGDYRRCDAYIGQLSRWAGSEFGCAELSAVLSFARKGVPLDCAGRGVVLFSVNGVPLWGNERIQRLWQGFCREDARHVGLCAGTGVVQPLAEVHPRGLLRECPSVKLISANEDGRLLFSSRMSSLAECSPIGAESSLMAHRALGRLLETATRYGQSAFAGFTDAGVVLPLSELIYGGNRERLLNSLSGSTVILLAVSAHSKGRLSLSLYREVSCGAFAAGLRQSEKPLAEQISERYGVVSEAARRSRLCIRLIDELLANGQEAEYGAIPPRKVAD